MPRDLVYERRQDFRGGRNVSVTPDLLNDNELVDCTNARLDTEFGAFDKRTGTRRLHTTALNASTTIDGVTQWDQGTGTNQVVAICNGDLFHKTDDFGEFSSAVSPANPFSTTASNQFVRHHHRHQAD